ncbi:hypothetical protein DXG01_001893 [Tephrocybe rancida]|nr:hypothetical protein DXG01_001893 [Tephrocybe rancida]
MPKPSGDPRTHTPPTPRVLRIPTLAPHAPALPRLLARRVSCIRRLHLHLQQMALYFVPAIGSYLLAKCIYLGPSRGHNYPHLPPPPAIPLPFGNVLDPLSRIFPFGRGLFEDKVTNFLCASNVVLKWREWAEPSALAGWKFRVKDEEGSGEEQEKEKDVDKGKKGTKQAQAPFLPLLPYALLNSSMSFFLFSFQVHEKTILLPLLPITLLLSGSYVDSALYSWGVLVNNVAVFSVWPLLKRDCLGVQYIARLLLWNMLVGYNPFRVPQKSFMQLLSTAVYCAALLLHLLELVVSPPARYPDLYAVLNVLVSTPVFVLAWLWDIKTCHDTLSTNVT